MQALSLPLLMGTPLFLRGRGEFFLLLAGCYFFSWLLLLRVKFYALVVRAKGKARFSIDKSLTAAAVIFALSLALGGLLSLSFPINKTLKGGFFPDESQGWGPQAQADVLQSELLDLQERLLNQVTALLPRFELRKDRIAAMGLLDQLLKESLIVMQVEKAEEGLVSYLKTPGLGLEPGEGEPAIYLLKEYLMKKIENNLKKIEGDIKQSLKKGPFNFRARADIMRNLEALKNSLSEDELLEKQKLLDEAITASSLPEYLKKEISEFAGLLVEWKAYQLKQGYPSERQRARERINPLMPEVEKQLSDPGETRARFSITALFVSALGTIFNLLPIGVFCLITVAIIFYFLAEKKKFALKALSRQDPNAFIIALYMNMQYLLSIFSLRYQDNFLPVAYAELIEKKYNIPEKIFLGLTACYEEARYSTHHLQTDSAVAALDRYNRLLREIFRRENKFWLFCAYWVTLAYKRPLLIRV